jgi:hypothetical protein
LFTRDEDASWLLFFFRMARWRRVADVGVMGASMDGNGCQGCVGDGKMIGALLRMSARLALMAAHKTGRRQPFLARPVKMKRDIDDGHRRLRHAQVRKRRGQSEAVEPLQPRARWHVGLRRQGADTRGIRIMTAPTNSRCKFSPRLRLRI